MTARLDAPPRGDPDTAARPGPSPVRPRGRSRWREHARPLAPVLLWVACVAYAAAHLRHGWVPLDAGALGESAHRVLDGQLPHRDFDAIYTGGLSLVNAAAFRLLGTSLLTLRLVLLAAFALWLPAVYAIASRVAPRWAALGTMALAAAWSIPVYPEAMPSWYNLFLATAGVWALMRAFETDRGWWLAAAGTCAALSCLVKITGLYFLAAALLALAFHEQQIARGHAAREANRAASWVVTAAAAAFSLVLVALVRHALTAAVALHFVLPGSVLAGLLVWREWTAPASPWRARLRTAGRLAGPFVAGAAPPVLLFLAPYARSHALGALAHGLFVLPFRRLDYTMLRPHGTRPFLAVLATVLLAPWAARGVSRFTRRAAIGLLGTALVVAPVAAVRPAAYRLMWQPLHVLVPLAIIWGAVTLVRRRADPRADERVYLLLAAAATCSLIQFPFAAPVYFFYAAPLALLAVVALAARAERTTQRLATVALASCFAFTVLRIHPASIYTLGIAYEPDTQASLLTLPRGGIEVTPGDSATYVTLARTMRAHAASGYAYATPDCPEVYFLSGLHNPTRTLFDFFDAREGRTQRILGALARHDVTVIALNTGRTYSRGIPADLATALAARYPRSARVGDFIVRWRE